VHGIVEVSPRPYKGRMSKARCEQLALKKGTSYVWGNGQLCHVYNVKLDVSKYSPSAGIRDWVTCTPTQGAAVETSEETEVGFIGDANRNLRGECTYGGQRIEGKCDIRPGYSNNCNDCTFGYTDVIWFNNWCCDKTDAINPKANKCTCPSAAGAAEYMAVAEPITSKDYAIYGFALVGAVFALFQGAKLCTKNERYTALSEV
jgi:hypothetical protein